MSDQFNFDQPSQPRLRLAVDDPQTNAKVRLGPPGVDTEAFAPVPLAWLQQLDADPGKLNVNGGAIAMGHPLGATGAMITGTMVDELERRNARRALESSFRVDPYDAITYNLLQLLDQLDTFETITEGDLEIKLHPDEVGVMREYVPVLARQAFDDWPTGITQAKQFRDLIKRFTSGIVTPFMLLYALHDGLVKPMPGRAFAPSLAESWAESRDHLTYTFTMRKNAKFHDGRPDPRRAPGHDRAHHTTASIKWGPGSDKASRSALTTIGPNVIGGTKCPSMTSQWMTRAPASMTSSTWAASRAKSADRIDGATPRTASNLRSCCTA